MKGCEIIYASEQGRQQSVAIEFEGAISVREAIERSHILDLFPEIDLQRNGVGIYGEIVALDRLIKDGERVEIYRPLKHSPEELRLKRLQD